LISDREGEFLSKLLNRFSVSVLVGELEFHINGAGISLELRLEFGHEHLVGD
jgi:hypothetical protein